MSEEEMNNINNTSDNLEGTSENKEVEVTEISLDDEEINEWIVKLATLKATKNQIQLDLDDDNELAINFEESLEDAE